MPVMVVWSPVLVPERFKAVRVPVKRPLPVTERALLGVVVPIPTAPANVLVAVVLVAVNVAAMTVFVA